MKKLIELREYDVITTNRQLAIDVQYVHIDQASFKLLENMVLTFNETDDADAIDFLSLSSKRNVGKVIRTKNYVGVIQLNSGVQLQILPKIYGSTSIDPKQTFLKMLKTLRNFPSKTFNEANLNTGKMSIFEVFIKLYIQEVQHLVKRGLKSSYYEVKNNLNVYKGKMLFSKQIKYNSVHKERFYVEYDEFGLNRSENRLIKSTLLKLVKESVSAENIKELRKLLVSFELVDPSSNIEKDFAGMKIDRNSKDYENIMQWSKIFLRNQSFTTFAGSSFGKALLFPMDKVFEAYVGRYLKKLLHNEQWQISLQDKGYYLFEKQFALRPDIVLRNVVQGRTIILDTKWKVLKNTPSSNYGISQADMYQMYAYAKKYKTNEIWLMYPCNDEFKETERICFESDDGVIVNAFFVDCHHIEKSLYEFMVKSKV